jgi:hypothetical protein
VTELVGWLFLVLWVLAFFMSINMLVQARRNPYVPPSGAEPSVARNSLLILGFMIGAMVLVGALLYFVPLP